jgi:hypothetical protein
LLKQQFPDTFFIAEDSGFESYEQVDKPLLEVGIPGVRCVQWENDKYQKLSAYPKECVSISSTHDLPTLLSWRLTGEPVKVSSLIFPRSFSNTVEPISWLKEMLDQLLRTSAQINIINLNDLLYETRRFNLPGTINKTNWQLRMVRRIETLNLDWLKPIIGMNFPDRIQSANVFAVNWSDSEIKKGKPNGSLGIEFYCDYLPEQIICHHNLQGLWVNQILSEIKWQQYKDSWLGRTKLSLDSTFRGQYECAFTYVGLIELQSNKYGQNYHFTVD